jgi:predicted DNA-binding protein
MEKKNPKLIRSFPSSPDLEKGLATMREKTGKSISSIIREAIKKFLGL